MTQHYYCYSHSSNKHKTLPYDNRLHLQYYINRFSNIHFSHFQSNFLSEYIWPKTRNLQICLVTTVTLTLSLTLGCKRELDFSTGLRALKHQRYGGKALIKAFFLLSFPDAATIWHNNIKVLSLSTFEMDHPDPNFPILWLLLSPKVTPSEATAEKLTRTALASAPSTVTTMDAPRASSATSPKWSALS